MQTNSPPKIDTLKKKIKKKNFKQDSQISTISPPFYHVLTKTTQSEGK